MCCISIVTSLEQNNKKKILLTVAAKIIFNILQI